MQSEHGIYFRVPFIERVKHCRDPANKYQGGRGGAKKESTSFKLLTDCQRLKKKTFLCSTIGTALLTFLIITSNRFFKYNDMQLSAC